jgi:hypothetical protein
VTGSFIDYLRYGVLLLIAVVALLRGLARLVARSRKCSEACDASVAEAVGALESAAFRCVTMIHIGDEAQDAARKGGARTVLQRVRLPPLMFSAALDWHCLPQTTRSALRDCEEAWTASERQIADLRRYDEAFSVCDRVTLACAQLGKRAWALAKSLRDEYGYVLGPHWADYELDALEVFEHRMREHQGWERRVQATQPLSDSGA